MMRFLNFFVAVLCLALVFATSAIAFTQITRTLRLGMTTSQVVTLQTMLNMSPDTQVATSGIGSPGQESAYFGQQTLKAVKKFQQKYASEVLYPAGVTAPTGVVGPLTIAALYKHASTTVQAPVSRVQKPITLINGGKPVYPEIVASSSVNNTSLATSMRNFKPVGFTPLSPNMTIPKGVNPNMINEDFVVEQLRKEGIRKGLSADIIDREIQNVRTILATTTDLRAEFFAKFGPQQKQSSFWGNISSPFFSALTTVGSFLGLTTPAQAAVTGLPFGGYIAASWPCTCSPTWQLLIIPPLPQFPTNLNVIPGLQAFSWYNLPMPETFVLGLYEPGVLSCFMYYGFTCGPSPVGWGTVSPIVGTSAL